VSIDMTTLKVRRTARQDGQDENRRTKQERLKQEDKQNDAGGIVPCKRVRFTSAVILHNPDHPVSPRRLSFLATLGMTRVLVTLALEARLV
jgi:hypothetical protein